MARQAFSVIATVEGQVHVSAEFPAYLTYWYGDDGRSSFDFFVRIDRIGGEQARIDFLKIDSDGEYEFRTEYRPLLRCGEFFRPHNSYRSISVAKFNEKIGQLIAALNSVPKE